MQNNTTKSRFSNKKLIVGYCIATLTVILAALIVFAFIMIQYNTGVITNLSVKTKGDRELELKLTYVLPMGDYSVREVSSSEGEYVGDGMVDYDGTIGQYRIMLEFGDMKPHDSLTKEIPEDGIFEIKNATVRLKAKIAYPSDHGFVLYLGSDTPIGVERVEDGKTGALFGSIRIPITIK